MHDCICRRGPRPRQDLSAPWSGQGQGRPASAPSDGLDLSGPARHHLRPGRPERRGQDHHGPDPHHPGPPDGGRRGWRVSTWCASRPRYGRVIGLAGQSAAIRRRPAGRTWSCRPAVRAASGRGPQPRPRAAGGVRPDGRGQPGGQDLLRRHAAAPGPGREPGRAAAGAVPGRADHGAGPAARRACGTSSGPWPPAGRPSC